MNWFKSLWLTSEERATLKRAKEEKESPVFTMTGPIVPPTIITKPYRKIIYDGGNISVMFRDGSIFNKREVKQDIFRKVRDANTEDEIYLLLQDEIVIQVENDKVDTIQERQFVNNNSQILDSNPQFEKKDGQVYLKGVNLAMPSIVTTSFIEILEKLENAVNNEMAKYARKLNEEFYALKMFWLKLALNPLSQSREDLLIFVRNNDVRITKNGNIVLYRRIVSLDNTDNKFTTFVSQTYIKMKRQKKWATNPMRHIVAQDKVGDYVLVPNGTKKVKGGKILGNLAELYKDLPNMVNNVYTSSHNRGKLKIQIGSIYQIPDSEINLDNGICAAGGLHAAAVDYNYEGFGDIPVVVLVNPSKAITVPRGETGKLRTTEMFIACINDKPRGVHFDEESLSAFDTEYHDFTLGELEEAVKNKSFDSISIRENTPAVSIVDMNTIADLLQNRIKAIV